jgi:hypothetical protein
MPHELPDGSLPRGLLSACRVADAVAEHVDLSCIEVADLSGFLGGETEQGPQCVLPQVQGMEPQHAATPVDRPATGPEGPLELSRLPYVLDDHVRR